MESFYNDNLSKNKTPLEKTTIKMISPVLSNSNQQQFNGLLTYANSTSNLNNLQHDDIIDDVIETMISKSTPITPVTKKNDYHQEQHQKPQLQSSPKQQQQQQQQQQSSYKTLNINTDESLIISPNNHHPSSISPSSTIMTTTSEINNNIDLNDHRISSKSAASNSDTITAETPQISFNKNYKRTIKSSNVSVVIFLNFF